MAPAANDGIEHETEFLPSSRSVDISNNHLKKSCFAENAMFFT
jgi:hypothetical protein